MCGIAGELRFTDSGSSADWAGINALMARRGPDDEGLWSDDSRCTLAFRRLAILDLSPAGHQPMATPDGRHVIVFNGELYNFKELRTRLEARGARFRSTGDSEVVLHALATWGPDALGMFNGMFALGFYDTVERQLLLARDHAGIKPLYYLTRPEGVVFASQYDQILAHPWSRDLAVSDEALGLYLRLAYIPAPYAVLQDTHMVQPGTWLLLRADGRTRHGQFFMFPSDEPPSLRGEEAVEAVDAAVTAAVQRQLVSDVPVGAFLSGGIDSPLVVAKMRDACGGTMRTFTIGTGDDTSDESADAIAYAQELGVAHTLEHVTPGDALAMLEQVIDACGEPFGDYSMFPTMLVSRLASREFKVMLSGDGGDELFWGYVGRTAPMLRAGGDFGQPAWQRKLRWAVRRGLRTTRGYDHLTLGSMGEWYRAAHTHLPAHWLTRIFPSLPAWPPGYDAFDYTGSAPDPTARWLRWNEFVSHLPMVLLKVDRASMYHSLEVRVPLLDRAVIEVAARVDWRSCLDLDQKLGKLPLRRALARHVRHQTHAKRGFEVPMGAWLRTSLRDVFEESVLGRHDLLGVAVDRRALRELFDLHLAGSGNYAWGLWPLLSLALWTERHYRRRPLCASA
jgi:asparagine synthase (glutamine-hydrolysing)